MRLLLYTNLLLFIFSSLSVSATGPSYINSEMNPISINDKGEILCRTRFEKNDTGGHWYQRTEYGLCVISNGKIIEYKTKILDPQVIDDHANITSKGKITSDEYQKLTEHWDWIYKTGLDFNNLSKQQKQICVQYGFKENNTEKFKVNKKVKLSDFIKEKNIDLKKDKQLALKGAKSVSYDSDSQRIHILYDFGNTLILSNTYREDPDADIGASFSYRSPLFGGIEYEYYRITGVLFL